ncbi:hypothetical protein DFH06DRAFT_1174028, partial [Mycena polygramma]
MAACERTHLVASGSSTTSTNFLKALNPHCGRAGCLYESASLPEARSPRTSTNLRLQGRGQLRYRLSGIVSRRRPMRTTRTLPADTPRQRRPTRRRKKPGKGGGKKTAAPKPPKEPVRRMHEGEDRNFLRFATALKILVGSSVRLEGLERAKTLLRDYLLNFSKLYGAKELKPNHHWAVHIPDQILDYGPVYGFWAFLTERLNKVLKNLNSNNWSGGHLEVSMVREFHRMAQLDGLLNGVLDKTSGSDVPAPLKLEHQFVQLLVGAGENKEALGTIQDAAAHERTALRVIPGTIATRAERITDDGILMALVAHYNKDSPTVHLPRATRRQGDTQVLGAFFDTYDYALLDGRRVSPTTRSKRGSAGSSLIQIRIGGEPYVGEIRVMFRHKQPGIPDSETTILAFISWLKPSPETPLDNDSFIWHEFPELGVDTWIHNRYAPPNDTSSPPSVLPLADIQCQVSRGTIKYTQPPLWITTTMDRFPSSLEAYGMGNATGED